MRASRTPSALYPGRLAPASPDRHNRRENQIPIALAAHPAPNSPRLRASTLFGRRLAERTERLGAAGVQKPAQLDPFAEPSANDRICAKLPLTTYIANRGVQQKPSFSLAGRTGHSATSWMDDRGRPRLFACSQAGRSQETIPRSPRRVRVQPPHAFHAAASSLPPSCEIPPLPPAGRVVGKATMCTRTRGGQQK